jgi:condensin-2 complex subunit G2
MGGPHVLLALLHDRLALLAMIDQSLVVLIVACFELAWHVDASRHEAFVAQTLPYLVALALTSGSSTKSVLHRLFTIRNVLSLHDYEDDQSYNDDGGGEAH